MLQAEIEHLLARPVGRRRPKEPIVFHDEFRYKADSWDRSRRVAAKEEWTRLSCHGFADNQARLQLFALAYDLGNFLRRFALPQRVGQWTLTTMKEKLIKIGAKVVGHARMITFQMAEVIACQGI